jgi:hypothetical protein
MAILKEGFEFTGGLGRLTAYKMKGSDKIIVRQKGGPNREQVMKSENFERTRQNMVEFKGVGLVVKAIRSPLRHVKHLSGYNFTPTLTSICKKIQVQDKIGERGQRGIYFSQHRFMLAGFNLHRKYPFSGIVAGPVSCALDRETKSAVIQLPRLIQGINLHLPWKQPLYRFCVSLGLVPDVVYEDGKYNNRVEDWADTSLNTTWHLVMKPFQSQTLELKLDTPHAINDSQTLLFAIGIEMGAPSPDGEIAEVKHCGSACILALG